MRRLTTLLLMLGLAATMALGGCKKKEEAKKDAPAKAKAEQKKVEKAPAEAPVEAPAEAPADAPAEAPLDAPAEAPADAPAANPGVSDVVEEAAAAPGVADVAEEAPAEASAEAPAEAPAEVPAEAPAEAPAEVPADAPAEVPAEGEIAAEAGATAEAGEPSAETDVVTEEAAANNPHFGREFKLEAVMMVKDVTKYPDHYSTFETIKLRGTVLAIAGDKVLLGHETTDGFYMVCVNMGDFARRELKVGQVMQFEGKLTKQEWNIEDFGALDTGDKEQGLAKGFALVVEAGESE